MAVDYAGMLAMGRRARIQPVRRLRTEPSRWTGAAPKMSSIAKQA
ncbi:hypothetical protein [Streptomyces sp. CB00316]|nr:hypothetical protein [Streptomyces sp. CB00316]